MKLSWHIVGSSVAKDSFDMPGLGKAAAAPSRASLLNLSASTPPLKLVSWVWPLPGLKSVKFA